MVLDAINCTAGIAWKFYSHAIASASKVFGGTGMALGLVALRVGSRYFLLRRRRGGTARPTQLTRFFGGRLSRL